MAQLSTRLHSISDRSLLFAFLAVAAALLGIFLFIEHLSDAFQYARRPRGNATFIFAALLSVAGVIYLSLFAFAEKLRPTRPIIIIGVLVGLIARGIFFNTNPILEDDWHRYLWDGGAVSVGVNPYSIPPARAMTHDISGIKVSLSDDPDIARLQKLGEAEPHFPERINYPFVATIYPPVAQAAFALAYQIAPFQLDAWRAVLLVVDALTLALLLVFLRRKNMSALWALLYWWNPIVIVSAFNGAHMDTLLGPFLIGAILLAELKRSRLAAIALAGAAGVKLWPLILAPIVFRNLRGRWREIFITGAVFAITLAIIFAPMAEAFYSRESGLIAYADGWRTNTFFFFYLSEAANAIHDNGIRVLRFIIAALIAAGALWMFFSDRARDIPMAGAATMIIIALYILGPTGYPWYLIWFTLLAPLAPSIGIASFTVALPLYYIRFPFSYDGNDAIFNWFVTPMEFIPPTIFAIWSIYRRRLWAL